MLAALSAQPGRQGRDNARKEMPREKVGKAPGIRVKAWKEAAPALFSLYFCSKARLKAGSTKPAGCQRALRAVWGCRLPRHPKLHPENELHP